MTMIAKLAILLIRAYQVTLGGLLGGHCRFYPSCSEYAIEAVREHGALRGAWFALRRIGKCHPLGPSGVDLVPQRRGSVS
jgi:hypothetical protein